MKRTFLKTTWNYKDVTLTFVLKVSLPPQLEIDNGDELTEQFLYDEVHPKQHAHKQAFAKPRGPAGKRGHKRLIKGPGEAIQDS